ncbi:hypothetical protein DM02DRAFT_628557 [Periconia macrospinosa]|uniref:Uncharacterized protein n=1 Tax=Periconia macrospinosa TaxID=97972 RepID=A0A2V1DQK6_9PLEO|nr:hypothetical protein DM02DRAFT_628557 [Periconia macrospinosa]
MTAIEKRTTKGPAKPSREQFGSSICKLIRFMEPQHNVLLPPLGGPYVGFEVEDLYGSTASSHHFTCVHTDSYENKLQNGPYNQLCSGNNGGSYNMSTVVIFRRVMLLAHEAFTDTQNENDNTPLHNVLIRRSIHVADSQIQVVEVANLIARCDTNGNEVNFLGLSILHCSMVHPRMYGPPEVT